MNKTELVAKVAEQAGIEKKTAEKAVTAVFDVIANALKAGDKVQLMGFGAFEVRERAAHMGRHPGTKEPMEIPASKSPVFKAGKTLRDSVK